jgi:hypothetical protein
LLLLRNSLEPVGESSRKRRGRGEGEGKGREKGRGGRREGKEGREEKGKGREGKGKEEGEGRNLHEIPRNGTWRVSLGMTHTFGGPKPIKPCVLPPWIEFLHVP